MKINQKLKLATQIVLSFGYRLLNQLLSNKIPSHRMQLLSKKNSSKQYRYLRNKLVELGGWIVKNALRSKNYNLNMETLANEWFGGYYVKLPDSYYFDGIFSLRKDQRKIFCFNFKQKIF